MVYVFLPGLWAECGCRGCFVPLRAQALAALIGAIVAGQELGAAVATMMRLLVERAGHEETHVGSVIKKRRKRMAKKKHRKLLRKTRVARRKAGK